MERAYGDEVDLLNQTDESLFYSFRKKGDRFRYNIFHWFDTPSSDEATLEMAIAGRESDRRGMRELHDQFVEQIRPLAD